MVVVDPMTAFVGVMQQQHRHLAAFIGVYVEHALNTAQGPLRRGKIECNRTGRAGGGAIPAPLTEIGIEKDLAVVFADRPSAADVKTSPARFHARLLIVTDRRIQTEIVRLVETAHY